MGLQRRRFRARVGETRALLWFIDPHWRSLPGALEHSFKRAHRLNAKWHSAGQVSQLTDNFSPPAKVRLELISEEQGAFCRCFVFEQSCWLSQPETSNQQPATNNENGSAKDAGAAGNNRSTLTVESREQRAPSSDEPMNFRFWCLNDIDLQNSIASLPPLSLALFLRLQHNFEQSRATVLRCRGASSSASALASVSVSVSYPSRCRRFAKNPLAVQFLRPLMRCGQPPKRRSTVQVSVSRASIEDASTWQTTSGATRKNLLCATCCCCRRRRRRSCSC